MWTRFYGGACCSAINCSTNQKKAPHLSFFRFPKNPERNRQWLINTRREDLWGRDITYLYNNIKLCALHFEDDQFMNSKKNKLVWNAVPTLFNIPNKLAGKPPTRKRPMKYGTSFKCFEGSRVDSKATVKQKVYVLQKDTSSETGFSYSNPERIFKNNSCASQSQHYFKVDNNMVIRKADVNLSNEREFYSVIKERDNECDAIRGIRNEFEMDSKVIIKEEIDILDTGLPDERHLCSLDYERNSESDTSIRRGDFCVKYIKQEVDVFDTVGHEKNDGDDTTTARNYFEIKYVKEEVNGFDSNLSNELELSSVDYDRNSGTDTATIRNNFEIDPKIKYIKEEVNDLDTVLPHKTERSETFLVRNIKKGYNENGEMSIKRAFAENVLQQNRNKDREMDDLKPAESSRLCVDAIWLESLGEVSEASSVGKNVHLHGSRKLESSKSYVSVLYSEKKVENSDATIENEIFEKAFIGKPALKLHNLIQEDRKVHKCDICQKSFTVLQTLKRHKLLHKVKNPCEFNTHSKSFSQVPNFKTPSLIHEDKGSHECNACKKSFIKLSDLKEHRFIHKGKKVHECSICKKSFAALSSLKIHSLAHEGRKTHKCSMCSKSYIYVSCLKRHSFIHEGEKPHECSVCKKRFIQLSHLREHILVHEGKKFLKCKKSFTHLSHLKTHTLIHKGKKPHECQLCKKRFSQLSQLKKHSLIHKGKMPHECQVCKKRFTQLSQLKRHTLIHNNKKPHECNVCKERFTLPSHLKMHTFFHKVKRSHECSVCKKVFSRLSNLRTHSLIHESKKTYECSICKKHFRRLSNLKTHSFIHEGKKLHRGNTYKNCLTQS